MSDSGNAKVLSLPTPNEQADLPLAGPDRQFAEEFFAGQFAGNATQSYRIVHPDASYNTASVEASDLLKAPKIREYLAELHNRAIELTSGQLRPWADLLPLAQATIAATAEGRLRNRLAFEAAVYLTNRVMGTPVASHEVHVINHERITKAVSAFARRLAEESGKLKGGLDESLSVHP